MGGALPSASQMRLKTHHWVRQDKVFQQFSAFFIEFNTFMAHVKPAESKGPNGYDAALHAMQLYVRGALNQDQLYDLGVAFKLANYLTESPRLDALRGTLLLHRHSSMYVRRSTCA